ncbi:HlyD family secretion protein [Rhodohalobacter sp. 8-1]|uniref:HlyD family secretion protein n=1 Tax=Rhodohalobacter sp. 8-1 TaxID=3131972 RepID=UPI0030EF0A12
MDYRKSLLITVVISAFFLAGLSGCENDEQPADAYGQFSADTYLVSPEMGGLITSLNVRLGDTVEKGDTLALVDTTTLHLKWQELRTQMEKIPIQKSQVLSEKQVLESQLNTLRKEYKRTQNMFQSGAATQQQMDQIEGKLEEANRRLDTFKPRTELLNQEMDVLEEKIRQIEDQLHNAIVLAPVNGEISAVVTRQGEMASPGKPVVEIVAIQDIYLKVFVSENQLSQIKIGESVSVQFDEGNSIVKKEGRIRHIASKAEFTPQNIQTRENRVDLVYAVEIDVSNKDRKLKSGMPGDVTF